jgi:hypothetical protein
MYSFQFLTELREMCEFATNDADAAIMTMQSDPTVIEVCIASLDKKSRAMLYKREGERLLEDANIGEAQVSSLQEMVQKCDKIIGKLN